MIITPNTVIPDAFTGTPDVMMDAEFTREVGGMAGGRWRSGFTEAVMKWFKGCGWLCYHTKSSAKSQEGFPDLVCVHEEAQRSFFAELKVGKNKPSSQQKRWLSALAQAGHIVYLWWPSDRNEMQEVMDGALVAAIAMRQKVTA